MSTFFCRVFEWAANRFNRYFGSVKTAIGLMGRLLNGMSQLVRQKHPSLSRLRTKLAFSKNDVTTDRIC